ncbi:MAG: T9SS type A sorting domain-containing protein [Chlorobi bacterium]|nr:T9SS type A sorting domain-containing protein [Chlorobiota bacterium]
MRKLLFSFIVFVVFLTTEHSLFGFNRVYNNNANPVTGNSGLKSAVVAELTITTSDVTNITENSATSGGNVTDEGTSSVIQRGVVVSTSVNPTLNDMIFIDLSSGPGEFTSYITNLKPGITYHVRAYAINETDTVYGGDIEFTTSCPADAPSHLEEGFESGVLSGCWAVIDKDGVNGEHWHVVSNDANTGTYSAYIKYDNASESGGVVEDWLITPAISLNDNSQLNYWESWDYPGYASDIYVKISTSTQTDTASFVDLLHFETSDYLDDNNFTLRTIDLSAYDGQTVYLAFVMKQNDGASWYIDDLEITSSCSGLPAITVQPEAQSVCDSSTTELSVTADNALTYQWKKDSVFISGANSATLTINNTTKYWAGNYYCLITNDCGTISSDTVAVSVNIPVSIITQPVSVTDAIEGDSVSFVVEAEGTDLTYQWKKDGVEISGANNDTLTFTSVATSDAGDYLVTVTGACGIVESDVVTLQVATTTDITSVVKQKIKIYPNPSQGRFTLTTEGFTLQSEIKIVDLNGKVVYFGKLTGPEQTIDISMFSSGVYNLIIRNGQEQKTLKLIIKK